MYKLIMAFDGDDRDAVEIEFPTEAAANAYMINFAFNSDPCDVHMHIERCAE